MEVGTQLNVCSFILLTLLLYNCYVFDFKNIRLTFSL